MPDRKLVIRRPFNARRQTIIYQIRDGICIHIMGKNATPYDGCNDVLGGPRTWMERKLVHGTRVEHSVRLHAAIPDGRVRWAGGGCL